MTPLQAGLLTGGVVFALMAVTAAVMSGLKRLIDDNAPALVVWGLLGLYLGAVMGVFIYCVQRFSK